MRDQRFGRRTRRAISRTTTRFRHGDRADHLERHRDRLDRRGGDPLVWSSHVPRSLR